MTEKPKAIFKELVVVYSPQIDSIITQAALFLQQHEHCEVSIIKNKNRFRLMRCSTRHFGDPDRRLE